MQPSLTMVACDAVWWDHKCTTTASRCLKLTNIHVYVCSALRGAGVAALRHSSCSHWRASDTRQCAWFMHSRACAHRTTPFVPCVGIKLCLFVVCVWFVWCGHALAGATKTATGLNCTWTSTHTSLSGTNTQSQQEPWPFSGSKRQGLPCAQDRRCSTYSWRCWGTRSITQLEALRRPSPAA